MEGNASIGQVHPVSHITGEGRVHLIYRRGGVGYLLLHPLTVVAGGISP